MSDQKKTPQHQEQTLVATRPKTKAPRKYKVILHNDDYTTMDFVIEVLVRFFQKSSTEATYLMLTVHHKGRAIGGVYSYEIAEAKVHQVTQYARQNEHPLLVTMEPEDEA